MCNKTLSSNKRQLIYNNNFVIINKLTGFPYPHRIRVNTTSVTIIQLNISFQFCGFRWHRLQSRLKLPQKWLHEKKFRIVNSCRSTENSSATETWLKILISWCCIKPCPYLETRTHLHYVITLLRHRPHVSGYFRKRRFFPLYLKKSASTRTVLKSYLLVHTYTQKRF